MIRQAQREYLQCLKEAEDPEDEFEASRGLTNTAEAFAYNHYIAALYTNIVTWPEQRRREFFNEERRAAIERYLVARRDASFAMSVAARHGLDAAAFEEWVQHNVTDRLAEMNALTFSKIKSHAALVRHNSGDQHARVTEPTGNRTSGSARSSRATCSQPNKAATTVHPVEPDTPAKALQQGIQGTVQVVVSLNADSTVAGARIQTSPSALLNEAAISAARRSMFQTEIRDCKPIAADYIFSVDFTSQ